MITANDTWLAACKKDRKAPFFNFRPFICPASRLRQHVKGDADSLFFRLKRDRAVKHVGGVKTWQKAQFTGAGHVHRLIQHARQWLRRHGYQSYAVDA